MPQQEQTKLMDWAGHVNRQDHNTALPQDFNGPESSKLQLKT